MFLFFLKIEWQVPILSIELNVILLFVILYSKNIISLVFEIGSIQSPQTKKESSSVKTEFILILLDKVNLFHKGIKLLLIDPINNSLL